MVGLIIVRSEGGGELGEESSSLLAAEGLGGGGNHPYSQPVAELRRTQINVAESKAYWRWLSSRHTYRITTYSSTEIVYQTTSWINNCLLTSNHKNMGSINRIYFDCYRELCETLFLLSHIHLQKVCRQISQKCTIDWLVYTHWHKVFFPLKGWSD